MSEQENHPSKGVLIASGAFFVILGLVVAGIGFSEINDPDSSGALGIAVFGLFTAVFAVWITNFAIKKTEERQKEAKTNRKTLKSDELEAPVYRSGSRNDFGSLVGGIVTIAFIIMAGWLVWTKVAVPAYEKYVKKYDKPWWSGVQDMKVCQAFGNENCYTVPVSSNGEEIVSISFPNGGYLTAYDSECAKAASFYDFDRFCRMWDSENRKWDILPY